MVFLIMLRDFLQAQFKTVGNNNIQNLNETKGYKKGLVFFTQCMKIRTEGFTKQLCRAQIDGRQGVGQLSAT